MPPDGGALRPRRSPDRLRPLARRALRRPPRGRRVRASGDRRQARPSRDRLGRRGGALAEQLALIAEPDDIAMGFGADDDGATPRRRSRSRASAAASRSRSRPPARNGSSSRPARDASIRQELVETLYHVLWELVHVFFDHRGLLEGRRLAAHPRHRRVEVPVSVSRASASTTWRGSSRTFAARCWPRRTRSASCARRRSPTIAPS